MPDADGAALAEVRDRLAPLGPAVVSGGPIGPLTTYRVGGAAALRVTARSVADLELTASAVAGQDLPLLVVGRGSNLLVSDRGFPGVAVVVDAEGFGAVAVDGTEVEAGAAVALPTLARRSVEAGLTGLEWAVGVPGSVGGAVRMNAGGHGSDTARSLLGAWVVDLAGDGRETLWKPDRLAHRYRSSAIGPAQVVTRARFALAPGDEDAGRRTIREIVRWRRDHQPGGQNAGSVFTNPPGDSAGRLIDTAGLKGRRWGTATVSTKHANFIQADPAGRADDVAALIDLVRTEVRRVHGVDLHPEVRAIGFGPSTSSGDPRSAS